MLSLPQAQLDEYADKLILNSAQSSFTRLYECVLAVLLPRPRRRGCALLSSSASSSEATSGKLTLRLRSLFQGYSNGIL